MPAPVLTYEDLGLIQGEGWLFRDLDLYIGERDRLALIGRNGAGKTTLLKCLAGLIETDEGERKIVPGTRVVLLEQDPMMTGHATWRIGCWPATMRPRPTRPPPLPARSGSTSPRSTGSNRGSAG